jgi:predicted NBD/HSP70 family sugar kinase
MLCVADHRPPDRARLLHLNGQVLVLREVHAGRVGTRADLTHQYGISRGSASELTARLRDAALLDEQPVDPSGKRGRPTTELTPHPQGPLVCAVDIGHEGWSVGKVALGGQVLDRRTGRQRDRQPDAVFRAVSAATHDLTRTCLDRVAVISVAVTGVVRDSRIVQASTLGWNDVDVPGYFADLGRPVLVGNDATLAGLAEARRGVARTAKVSLHLAIDVGLGGVLIVDGRPQTGATGAGGEFGHLPFGDPQLRCPCGAYGCWDLDVDGRALARILGQPSPADPRSFAEGVLAAAKDGDSTAKAAADQIAARVGRGAGALVNALDPELVTLSSLGINLLAVSGAELVEAYQRALMGFRRADAPPVLASTAPRPASLIGAAEAGFDHLLTEAGLHEYITRHTSR